jgi:hypothetical protein
MSDSFLTDAGTLPARKVIATWKGREPALIAAALEQTGDEAAGRLMYRIGDSVVTIQRAEYEVASWLSLIARCRSSVSEIREFCDPGARGELSKANWPKILMDDLGCKDNQKYEWDNTRVEMRIERYANVTGDGKPEAFIAASCIPVRYATSSWANQVEVFDGSSDPLHPSRLDILLNYNDGTDDRGLRVRFIIVAGRTVTVDSLAHRPEDGNAMFSWRVQDTFSWQAGRFVRGKRYLTPAN